MPGSCGGRGGARRLQDRKFGRKESARTKTDLTDPPNDLTDKRISGGEVSAFEGLLLDCFRFFFPLSVLFCFFLHLTNPLCPDCHWPPWPCPAP